MRQAGSDLVLIGKPGIGKTFLLERLMDEDWGLFDAGYGRISELEDAIREFGPRRVIVDDSHLAPERIAQLRQLRREMGANFAIVAVSWPGQQEDVAAALPGSSRYILTELERDRVLQIIQEVGIEGPPDLQRLIIDEARGRAGLAVSLAHACVGGNIHQVASGEALVNDLGNWHARVLGRDSRYVLGFLSLAGRHGATIRQAAQALNLPGVTANEIVRGLASSGVIDEVASSDPVARLRVQPEIFRCALVRDIFFGGPGSLDVGDALQHLDRATDALVSVIGAVHRGANVRREFLLSLLNDADEESIVAYALLGENELQQALALAPARKKAIAQSAYLTT